jgi:hypothetical protein
VSRRSSCRSTLVRLSRRFRGSVAEAHYLSGYTIPRPSMIGALRWITWINPLRYGFAAVMGKPSLQCAFLMTYNRLFVRSQRVPHAKGPVCGAGTPRSGLRERGATEPSVLDSGCPAWREHGGRQHVRQPLLRILLRRALEGTSFPPARSQPLAFPNVALPACDRTLALSAPLGYSSSRRSCSSPSATRSSRLRPP